MIHIPESLVTRILQKKCILFLGSGATKESGGALGSELGKYIYNQIGDIGIDYKENLGRYTQLLVNAGYRNDIERIIRSRFLSLRPSTRFCNIASIPWKAIYTTNYDDLVEKAYSKQHFYNCVVKSSLNLEQNTGKVDVPLYKINGDINLPYSPNKPLVITLNDLRCNKQTNEKMISQLMRDMNDTFIFLGYSFQDENEIVTDILDAFQKTERWESVKEKYVVLPHISDDIKLDLESYKIDYIQGTADEFFDFIAQKSKDNFAVKLNALKKNYASNDFFKNLEPRILQYISECFDVYDSSELYHTDGKYFYRGGRPDWGIIKEQFDVSRDIKIQKTDNSELQSTTESLFMYIQGLLKENRLQKVKLEGASVSGKTTALYRCAYDLITNGTLSLIFKQQSTYKTGILSSIYEKIQEPFVIILDDVFIDINELIKMIAEAESNNLPLLFIIASRNSDWANALSNYNKNVLQPFDSIISMMDSFSSDEASKFVAKLIDSKTIFASSRYERNGYIKTLQEHNNIIEILIELIDNNEINKSLINEYDSLCPETKYAYGIVSLIYKYGLKTKWEILQRTISSKYNFTWNDFINKILKNDAKGTLYDDEIQGNFYILGRHRYICEKIVQIHFAGKYSDEIAVFKELILACSGLDNDEYFIGGLLNSILRDEKLYYSKKQIIDLLNFALNNFENKSCCAFINHIKGEYYLSHKDYLPAIRCFDSNVQNKLNVEYSLHSLGKTYFYLAQCENIESGEARLHLDLSIEKLMSGLKIYKQNEYYYALLISIFNYLETHNKLSEKNKLSRNEMFVNAHKHISNDTLNTLLNEKANNKLTME